MSNCNNNNNTIDYSNDNNNAIDYLNNSNNSNEDDREKILRIIKQKGLMYSDSNCGKLMINNPYLVCSNCKKKHDNEENHNHMITTISLDRLIKDLNEATCNSCYSTNWCRRCRYCEQCRGNTDEMYGTCRNCWDEIGMEPQY